MRVMDNQTKSDDVRRRLAAIPAAQRCAASCPGWHVNHESWEPERCDQCSLTVPMQMRVLDRELEVLPEVQAEMKRAEAEAFKDV
jgi:hypothetical protein